MRTLAEIAHLRTAACRDAADAVAQIAAGEEGIDPRAGSHVASCLRCQAEVAAYRRVFRTMRSMRDDLVPPPHGVLSGLLRELDTGDGVAAGSGSWAVRVVCGGITAAGAAGVLVWFTRRRPGLPHAS